MTMRKPRPENLPQGGSQSFPPKVPEADTSIPHVEDAINAPAPPSSHGFSTPSVVLSTSSASSVLATPRGSTAGVSDINEGIQGIQLEQPEDPLDIGALAAALPRASPSAASPERLLRPRASSIRSESSRPSTAGNRRSSSRTGLLRHNVRDEEPPRDRFHEPAFQNAFRIAKSLMGSLAAVLGTSAPHLESGSVIQSLWQEAQALANFQCRPTRVVGLVGETGAGKSSLLNSLLDVCGLARTSTGGAACTCVATEYRYHEDDDFLIDVEEFSNDELQQQFAEMVRNYRSNQAGPVEIGDDECAKEGARDSTRLAELACDTFSAMFRGRFSPSLLTSGEQEEVVETLLGWARERNSAAGQLVAVTPEECSTQLTRLTSEETPPRGPAFWPYIKKISVSLNTHLLSNGLVLVDLPGLRDLNSARRVITERYLRTCDEIFAVCPIGRATDDAGVMKVFRLAREARLSNVGIICTRADDVNAEEAKKDLGSEKAARIQELKDALIKVNSSLECMGERLEELKEIGDDNLDDGGKREKNELRDNIDSERTAKKKYKQALQRYLITSRNAFVTTQLIAKYGSQIPEGNLAVFCASNTMYWKYRNNKPSESLPFLQMSGIIGLRRHCMALVSEGQLKIALKYMRDQIPNLVSRVELWVQSGAGSVDVERKRAIKGALDLLEAQIQQKFADRASPLHALSSSLLSDFNEIIYQRRNIDGWTQSAIRAGHNWGELSPASYAAFCRHYGIHTTRQAGYHNWNEEAIEAMARELSGPWKRFQQALKKRSGTAEKFINDAFDSAFEQLLDLPEKYNDVVSPLHHALASCQVLLGTEIVDLCEEFEGNVSELRTNALSGLETAFFCQDMKQTYISANRVSGTGSWAIKKSIINGKLEQRSLFVTLMRRFRNGFSDLGTALQDEIQTKVRERLDFVAGMLDIIRSDNGIKDCERDLKLQTRVAEEIRSAKVAMEDIRLVFGNDS